MARIKGKDLYLKDDDQVYFGDNHEAALWYANNELQLDHTISGTWATQGYHLVRKDQLPDEFLDFIDTPATYSGHAGKFVYVKPGEDGLEFIAISGTCIAKYLDVYDSVGGTDISSGWTDVPLDLERKITTAFSHSGSSPEITINEPGTYIVISRVSADIVSGTARSESEMRMMRDQGSGYTVISGTIGRLYHRTAPQGENTATVCAILDFNLGDKIKTQARRVSGTSTIELLAEGSSLVIFSTHGPKGEKGEKGDPGSNTIAVEDDGVLVEPYTDTLNFVGFDVEETVSGTVTVTASGVDSFLGLIDTPATYSGHAGKVVTVNSAENGLQFSSATASGTLYVLFTPGVLMPGDAGARPSMRIAGPVGTYAFDDSKEESCFSSFRTPDAYLANTDVVFEFGCFNNDTQVGVKSVRWAIDYHVYAPWDLFTSKTTSTYAVNIAFPNNATAGTLGYGRMVIPYNDANNPLSANKGFMFRIYRDATSGSDTLVGDALLSLCVVSLNVNT